LRILVLIIDNQSALAKAGFTVAHLDPNQYYGAEQASLTIDELREWASQHTNGSTGLYSSISSSSNIIPQSRQYAVSLSPAVIRAVGPLISTLVASGVSRYGGYKLLDRIGVYGSSGSVRVVPGSKDAVFKSKDLSLIDKRRLMRFLMFAADDFENRPELEGKQQMPFLEYLRTTFSLPQPVSEAVAYAIAFCGKATGDVTLRYL
jgi:Rab proteins geranylgeranyltransferase component A